MEQVKFNYSTKNIPISSHKEYLIELIHSVAKFVANLEKRTYYYLNPIEKTHEKETFGFNSTAARIDSLNQDSMEQLLTCIQNKTPLIDPNLKSLLNS